MQEVKRVFDLLPHIQQNLSRRPVFGYKENKEWKLVEIDEYAERTNNISYGLLQLGVKKGDRIAIISSSRPEWNMLDMAILQIGAISIPIYATISQDDYLHIFNHAEIKIIFIDGKELHTKIVPILDKCASVENIYTFTEISEFEHLEQIEKLGQNNQNPELLESLKANIDEYDMATIIYTSGTTGNPKGVMLSHSNFVNNFLNLADIPADWSTRALSFLPLSHVYERVMIYLLQYKGITIYYAENMASIADNIKEVNPNIMSCVPRFLEKMYDKLYTAGKSLPKYQRKIYYWAIELAKGYPFMSKTLLNSIKHKIADILIYKKMRAAIGGDFDIMVSGGSALQVHISSFFQGIGIPVFEGYGLTETSPVIAVSRRGDKQYKPGTVGPVLPGVEVKIDTNKEICCRGHNVMLGYYKNEEATKEAIDAEGWFRTGDMGVFTPEGLLRITGRLKMIFKTSFGKYINPIKVEELFCESAYIENIIVVGENQKFAAALIVPDFMALKAWAKRHNIPYATKEELIQNTRTVQLYRDEVASYNIHLGDWEQIKKIQLIADEWTQENGIITPTLKVKRLFVQDKYKETIASLFS